MAWFKNGRKYWKYKNRIYSCRKKYPRKKKYKNLKFYGLGKDKSINNLNLSLKNNKKYSLKKKSFSMKQNKEIDPDELYEFYYDGQWEISDFRYEYRTRGYSDEEIIKAIKNNLPFKKELVDSIFEKEFRF